MKVQLDKDAEYYLDPSLGLVWQVKGGVASVLNVKTGEFVERPKRNALTIQRDNHSLSYDAAVKAAKKAIKHAKKD